MLRSLKNKTPAQMRQAHQRGAGLRRQLDELLRIQNRRLSGLLGKVHGKVLIKRKKDDSGSSHRAVTPVKQQVSGFSR
jgi:hypothetical protein